MPLVKVFASLRAQPNIKKMCFTYNETKICAWLQEEPIEIWGGSLKKKYQRRNHQYYATDPQNLRLIWGISLSEQNRKTSKETKTPNSKWSTTNIKTFSLGLER